MYVSLRKVALAGSLAVVASLVAVAPAGAAPLPCGHVFATAGAKVVLKADVGPCAGGGLVVRADNVTLDLNGHSVRGTGVFTDQDRVGILLDGTRGVKVQNGTVSGFDAGVVLSLGSRNVVRQMQVLDNVGSGNGNFGDGVLLAGSKLNLVKGNVVRRNGPFDGIGMFNPTETQTSPGAGPSGNTIDGNQVTDNAVVFNPPAAAAAAAVSAPGRRAQGADGGAGQVSPHHSVGVQQDDGIRIEGGGASFNFVLNNTVSRNGLDGIALFRAFHNNTHNVVENNRVLANGFKVVPGERRGFGIVVFGSTEPSINPNFTIVADNVVRHNGNVGIEVGSSRNQIRGNTALGNTPFDLEDTNPGCDANNWQGDTFGTHNPPCAD